MLAHTIKTMLELGGCKTKLWYDDKNRIHVISTSYDSHTKEYHIMYSGISLYFTRFKFDYHTDRLNLYYDDELIAFVYGELL